MDSFRRVPPLPVLRQSPPRGGGYHTPHARYAASQDGAFAGRPAFFCVTRAYAPPLGVSLSLSRVSLAAHKVGWSASFGQLQAAQATASGVHLMPSQPGYNWQVAIGNQLPSGPAVLTGQVHHPISRIFHRALEAHPLLSGIYTSRDPRFVTQARDAAAHRGYDRFHRNLDAEVSGLIRANPNANQSQFESYLRGVYQRPDVNKRFPNGL